MNTDASVTPPINHYAHLLRINLAAIAAVLNQHGYESASVSYSGMGDDGRIDTVSVAYTRSPLTENLPDTDVFIVSPIFSRSPGPPSTMTGAMPFRDACEQVANDAIDVSGHNAYHLADGGGGTLTIYSDGRAVLSHYDYAPDDTQEFDEITFDPLPSSEPRSREDLRLT